MSTKDDVRTRLERVRGAFRGAAVADALAFPYKGRSRAFVKSLHDLFETGYATHESTFFPAGQVTDDTQQLRATLRTIAEEGDIDRVVLAEHLVPLWRDGFVVDPGRGSGEVIERLVRGEVHACEAGRRDGHLEADALTRALPVGFLCRGDRTAMARGVETAVGLTHRDERVLAAAAGLASAVELLGRATEVYLSELLDGVSELAARFHGPTSEAVLDFPRLLSKTEFRALEQIADVTAAQCDAEFPRFWDRVPDQATFQLLAALYLFLRTPFDYRRTVRAAFNAGGETTTLCALCGALCGSLLGPEALPEELVDSFLEADILEEELDAYLRVLAERWARVDDRSESADPASPSNA